ncbi:MAG: hypothetical protein ACFFB5_23755 [Promethearchaeota archaeon]
MASLYWFGVFLAITSGVVNNFGTVLQKKVVNDVPQEHRDDKFYRTLLTNRLWLFGLILQNGIGAIFFMWAQIYVGPALIPGLMAAGLIVLALGSLKIVGEELELPEVIGILLMIGAITMLGLSSMAIDIADYEVLNLDFLVRVGLFTFGCFAFMIVFDVGQRRTTRDSYKGLYLAIVSGFCFALANFWVFPLMATIVRVFEMVAVLGEVAIFVFASVLLTLTNIYGIKYIQDSFKVGRASILIPIQQIPIQITPALVYLIVFLLVPPGIIELLFFLCAIVLIIISSFLLAKRQAQIEEIQ